jgi:hypothetical protein
VKIAFLLSVAVLAASGIAAAKRPELSVAAVISQHEALDGQIVRVRGWLNEQCYYLSCGLSSSDNGDGGLGLSLGESRRFDIALKKSKALGHEIIVEGRVHRLCFDHSKDPDVSDGEIVVCTDRANQLSAPRLIKVIPRSVQDN